MSATNYEKNRMYDAFLNWCEDNDLDPILEDFDAWADAEVDAAIERAIERAEDYRREEGY